MATRRSTTKRVLTEPEAKKLEDKDAALPDSVEDRTNIGERDVAGESTTFRVTNEVITELPPPPVAATDAPDTLPDPLPTPEPEPIVTGETLITVTGTLPPGHIAIAEVNLRHPDGQIVITGTDTKQAAPTQRVMEAISNGKLTQA